MAAWHVLQLGPVGCFVAYEYNAAGYTGRWGYVKGYDQTPQNIRERSLSFDAQHNTGETHA